MFAQVPMLYLKGLLQFHMLHLNYQNPYEQYNGRLCMLQAPLKTAKDCVLHRHFAQLAATLALFKSEKTTRQQLQKIGIADVDAVLLYVDDGGSMLYELPEWWQERGPRILNNICQN